MRSRILIGALLSLGCVVAQATPLTVVQAYPHPPGVYHVVLENTATEDVALSPRTLRKPGGAIPVHAWWLEADAERLAPGERAIVSFALKRSRAPLTEAVLHIGHTEDPFIDVDITPVPLPVMATTLLYDGDAKTITMVLKNAGEESLQVDAVVLGTRNLTGNSVTLPGRRTACWVGEIAAPDAIPSFGNQCLLTLRGDFGEVTHAARLFPMEDPRFVSESKKPEPFRCPSHRYGSWDNVLPALQAFGSGHGGGKTTVHFCRNRLPATLNAFGQQSPHSIVNVQAANPDRGQENPWPGFLSMAEAVRDTLAPGQYTALVENATIYKGAFGQLAEAPSAPVDARELRALCYVLLAHGSRGLYFRDKGGDETWRAAVTAELQALTPLLKKGVPVNEPTLTLPEGVQGWTLSCGAAGTLVVLLNEDFNTPRETVAVSLPTTETTRWASYLEVGGKHGRGELKEANGALTWTVPTLDGVAVFVLRPGEE